jgi:hypothetical protein
MDKKEGNNLIYVQPRVSLRGPTVHAILRCGWKTITKYILWGYISFLNNGRRSG